MAHIAHTKSHLLVEAASHLDHYSASNVPFGAVSWNGVVCQDWLALQQSYHLSGRPLLPSVAYICKRTPVDLQLGRPIVKAWRRSLPPLEGRWNESFQWLFLRLWSDFTSSFCVPY